MIEETNALAQVFAAGWKVSRTPPDGWSKGLVVAPNALYGATTIL